MTTSPTVSEISALAEEARIERVHVLAWRDLVDIEAGGSELHAAKVLALWSEAGLDVTMRTSYAQGHPYEGRRDGYRIVRKHGRFMVFPTTVISVNECDPLRDEGIAFYRKLVEAGVNARCRNVLGTMHATELIPIVCPEITSDAAAHLAAFATN